MDLTEKEQKLAAHLLKTAADEFARHGCNDLNVAQVAGFTKEDCEDLSRRMAAWDNDPGAVPSTSAIFDDWYLMRYFAARFEGKA